MKRDNLFLVLSVFFILPVFLFLYGCRETIINEPADETQQVRLKKTISDENHHFYYEYIGDKMAALRSFRNGAYKLVDTIHYDEKGRVIKIDYFEESFPDGKQTSYYEYDAGGNLKAHRYYWIKNNGNLELRSNNTFEYDQSGRVVKVFYETNSSVAIIKYDENGNMTELSQYKDEALISKTTCEYGSELSPFYKLFPNAVDQPVVMSKNIRTKEVYTSYSETGQSVITSIYSFNFGSQKYPESYHYITTYKFDGSESVDSGFVRFEYY